MKNLKAYCQYKKECESPSQETTKEWRMATKTTPGVTGSVKASFVQINYVTPKASWTKREQETRSASSKHPLLSCLLWKKVSVLFATKSEWEEGITKGKTNTWSEWSSQGKGGWWEWEDRLDELIKRQKHRLVYSRWQKRDVRCSPSFMIKRSEEWCTVYTRWSNDKSRGRRMVWSVSVVPSSKLLLYILALILPRCWSSHLISCPPSLLLSGLVVYIRLFLSRLSMGISNAIPGGKIIFFSVSLLLTRQLIPCPNPLQSISLPLSIPYSSSGVWGREEVVKK